MSESSGPPPGPEFNPQTGFPVPGPDEQSSAPQPPPPYGQPAYGQPYPPPPAYPQQPYPQEGYPQQQGYPGQPGYPAQPGYAYQPYAAYTAPNHPKATTALVLGLVSLVGGLMCIVPVLVSPFAWVTGVKARKEIRQSNGQMSGDGMATAGMVLGIIGTVVLALILIGIVVFVIVAINDPSSFDDSGTV